MQIHRLTGNEGHPITAFGPNVMIGRLFYGPETFTEDIGFQYI